MLFVTSLFEASGSFEEGSAPSKRSAGQGMGPHGGGAGADTLISARFSPLSSGMKEARGMARQYSAKTFLRKVPNSLLKQYFKKT